MRLTLGFSPCPNDTFIFDALVNGAVDAGGITFEVFLEDVQTLNEWAQQGRLDVTKISYGVLPKISRHYKVLRAGGAMGNGVGPLLISGYTAGQLSFEELSQVVSSSNIAIPGADTTAHFLFSRAFPHATRKEFLRFDEVEEWVAAGKGLGVIIHENRFTYAQKGLHKWVDLGSLWERQTGLPIPLGGIAVKKGIPVPLLLQLNKAIQQSIGLAWKKYPDLPGFVTSHAQEMSASVIRSHIELYVNAFSCDMQQAGRNAIINLLHVLTGKDDICEKDIFV